MVIEHPWYFKSTNCQSLHELQNEIRQTVRDCHKRSWFENNADDCIKISKRCVERYAGHAYDMTNIIKWLN